VKQLSTQYIKTIRLVLSETAQRSGFFVGERGADWVKIGQRKNAGSAAQPGSRGPKGKGRRPCGGGSGR